MNRRQIKEALDTIPDQALLGNASSTLTSKQKRFAREVAKGATKAEAYRRSYKAKPAPSTIRTEPYNVAAHPSVAREIEAYKMAMEAAEYRTPVHLRALIVSTLTQTILDPEVPPSVRVQAVRVLGTITEVSAFTHRTETTVIKKSDDAKAQLLQQLQDMMRTVDEGGTLDAEALLTELAGPHRAGGTPDASVTHRGETHSNPHNESPNNLEMEDLNEIKDIETPPVSNG
jgi:hypothetical protein